MKVADNSGAKYVKCVNTGFGFKKRSSKVSDLITVSISKLAKGQTAIKKKKKYLALILGTKKKVNRKNGIFVKWSTNRVLLFSDQRKFLGSRVYGPICKEVRKGKKKIRYRSIISYSDFTV